MKIDMLFEGARKAVLDGGELLLDRSMARQVNMKGAHDFVTAVDTVVQELMACRLSQMSPEIGFVGEEGDGAKGLTSGCAWILDPVDGTSNLIHGYNHSSVSLALVREGTVEIGIIYDPFAGELFSAVRGEGARLNGGEIRVPQGRRLEMSNISFGAAPGDRGNAGRVFAVAREVYSRCHDLRRMGSAALELCYVAAGRQEGYYEFKMKPWDIAAGILIVKEAGGIALTPDGAEVSFGGVSDIVAACPGVWGELAAIIRENME